MTDPKTVTVQERLRYCDEFGIFTASMNGMAVSYGEAADLLDRCKEALELFASQAVFDPHTHRASVDEFVVSKTREALTQLNGGRNVG